MEMLDSVVAGAAEAAPVLIPKLADKDPFDGASRPACGALALEHAPQQLHILGEGLVGGAQFVDFTDRVHDRRMVAAAEFPANFR